MKNKKISYFYLAIIFLLILVIIALIMPKKEFSNKTTNVDIFEIKCNCDDNDLIEKSKEVENNSKNSNISTKKDNNQSATSKDNQNDTEQVISDIDDGKFVVKTSKFNWESNQKINIFANPLYDMNSIIAPGSSNIYKFKVKNSTDYDLKYYINFSENNEHNINMKYRLKKGDYYLMGDENNWVEANELYIANIYLSKKNSDTYYLEWKWFESDNDTAIGKKDDVKYNLKINVKAEEVNEN